MSKSSKKAIDIFDKIVLGHPIITIVIFLLLIAFFTYHAQDFRIDASSETLLNENNQELNYYRTISKRYETKDFILITYKPYNNHLFSKETLSDIKNLKQDILKLKRFDSVVTLLDVPLLETAYKGKIKDLTKNLPTLDTPGIKISSAIEEFKDNPLYTNMIVSSDLSATAIQIILKSNKFYDNLIDKQTKLANKLSNPNAPPNIKSQYNELKKKLRKVIDQINDVRHRNITALRNIVKKYQDKAKVILGGVPVIADDLILFIKND
jgi:predicted RND superfamily exporter protein